MSGAVWPGGDAGESPRIRLPQEDWAFPRAHPRYASVLRRLGEDGRFELLGLVEEGGQALLWAARDHGDGERLVVVKAPDPTSKDTTVGPRLGREARLLELLAGSPHVMPLLTAGPGRQYGGSHGEFESELPWLALPYRPHVLPPAAIAAAGGPFGPDQAWTLARDLAAGLEHLHARGVVHRDLSPGNVLLTPSGVVIADLGMAWAGSLEDDAVEARFTTGVTTRGGRGVTWGWLAPEAARWSSAGERPDRRPAADVFCWGLHVFVALVGRHPWAARGLSPDDREQDWMYDGRPADLGGLDDVAVPARFRDLVRAALSGDPDGRPDAGDLLAGLGAEPPSAVLAGARLADLEDELRRTRTELATAAAPPAGEPAAPEGTPRGLAGAARLGVPLVALLVAALVAGLVLASGYVRDHAAAGRQQRVAAALLASNQLFAAMRDEFGVVDGQDPALRRARDVTNRQLARWRTRLDAVDDRSDDLQIWIETSDAKLSDLPNARSLVDRLLQSGNLRNEAGSTQVRQATGQLYESLSAVTDELAAELGAGTGTDGPVAQAGALATPLTRAVQGFARYQDSIPVQVDSLDTGTLVNLAHAMADYERGLDDAGGLAVTESRRGALIEVANEHDTLKRWDDELGQLTALPVAQRTSGPDWLAQRDELNRFLSAHFQMVAATLNEVVLEAESQARDARRDAVLRLGLVAGAALLVLLAFAAPQLPWNRLVRRRRPDTSGPTTAEAVPDRVPAGVP